MVHHPHGEHHFHKRKRIYQKFEKYPNPDKWKRLVDNLIYPVIFFGIIMTIPQITEIWVAKNASGVSAISWASYIVTAGFWLLYGILHRDKPVFFSSAIWIFLEAFIVIGALLYG